MKRESLTNTTPTFSRTYRASALAGWRALLHDRRGVSTVEYALLLVAILLLVAMGFRALGGVTGKSATNATAVLMGGNAPPPGNGVGTPGTGNGQPGNGTGTTDPGGRTDPPGPNDVPRDPGNPPGTNPTTNNPVVTDPNTAVFWSGNTDGVGGAQVSSDIAGGYGAVTLGDVLKQRGIPTPADDDWSPAAQKFWTDKSREFAEGASGTVRVVLGENRRPGNIWDTVEMPTLKNNPNVTQIIAIDPKTKKETVIYTRP
ncbi:hypothetical protein [Pendulispora albinea]|uniref:Flp pilus assembly protein TadG n=1 Tax=Pendulispora albinea TaxID=2741071 RepID=A0ABZ2LX83_9BACT